MYQKTQTGGLYGASFGNMAGLNPLTNPAFKIPGGESPYKQPVLPKEESPEENIPFFFPGQPQLPSAGIGNVGGVLLAQAQSRQTLKQLIGNRPGGMSDIPGDVRFRQDTQFLPYDPGNYAQNTTQNPLRGYRWPANFSPRGYVGPGISPYFGRYQGPGLQGEMGTGAI